MKIEVPHIVAMALVWLRPLAGSGNAAGNTAPAAARYSPTAQRMVSLPSLSVALPPPMSSMISSRRLPICRLTPP